MATKPLAGLNSAKVRFIAYEFTLTFCKRENLLFILSKVTQFTLKEIGQTQTHGHRVRWGHFRPTVVDPGEKITFITSPFEA